MSVYGEGLYVNENGERVEVAERPAQGWEPVDEQGRPLRPVPTTESKAPSLGVRAGQVRTGADVPHGRWRLRHGGLRAQALQRLRPRPGTPNPYTGVLAIFASRLANGPRPMVFEDGEQRRDFVHVEDVPLELGYARTLLEQAGHQAKIFDGALDALDMAVLAEAVAAYGPEMTVVTTAPTYLFWRCAQPELRIPRAFIEALGGRGGCTVAVGPHGSVTPGATLAELGCDFFVRGECEEAIVEIAGGRSARDIAGLAFRLRQDGGHGRAAIRCLFRAACTALAGYMDRPAPSPSPLSTAPPGPRRRGRGLPRLPLCVQLLRQDRLS